MPDLIYNVKFNIEDNLQPSAAGVERYKQEIEEAKSEIAELKAQLDAASNSSKGFVKTGKGVEASAKRMNSSFSSANQALFSFSDLTQDAAQFQQGFGTGMRAIGNNVGFTAELLANLNVRVKEHNAALMAQAQAGAISEAAMRSQATTVRAQLLSSLIGPGGLLIGINLVVTAITIFTQHLDKNKRAARDAATSNSALNSVINKQVKALQDARAEYDSMFDRDSISARTQALTIERNRNTATIEFLKEQRELNKQNLDATQQTINLRQTDTAIKALASEERKQELRDAEANLPFLEHRQKILDNEIKSLEDRNNEILDGFYLLNLEEQAMSRMNKLSEEGNTIREKGIIPSVSDPLLIEDSIEASKELEMFRAEQIDNELERARTIRDLRIQDAEDRRFTLQISETRERLIKEEAEQEYQDAVREVRNQEMKDEIDRRNQVLEMEREHAEMRLGIEKQLSQSRYQVNQQLVTSLQSSFSALFGKNKAVALLSLAVEKGLAIAKVIADSRENAAELEAESVKLASIGAAYSLTFNPLAGQYFAASATAKAGAVKTLATGRKNAAKIAAIGLLQGAGALSGGGGGGGAAGSGSRTSPQSQQQTPLGFSEGPSFRPTSNQMYQPVQIKISNTVDRNGIVTLINDVEREISEDGIFLMGNEA